jgi:SAM-dependent methyltransferase
MTESWKERILVGAAPGELPDGYRRQTGVVGRGELLDASGQGVWAESEFVARSRTPHTTSAVEARIRRRHLERMVGEFPVDRGQPVLDLGCADGTVAHDLLELGFGRVVSTDILPESVAALDRSLDADASDKVLLVVDDMLQLPVADSSFGTVIAWGILSVSGDFDRALDSAWRWLAPGGHLLLAEPLLEQALVYPLVRGDLAEFRRVRSERTRAAMWDRREERYPVNDRRFYSERLAALPSAAVVESGGVSMLPSLALGGVLQDVAIDDAEKETLAELLGSPEFDELALWRQAYWLVRKG